MSDDERDYMTLSESYIIGRTLGNEHMGTLGAAIHMPGQTITLANVLAYEQGRTDFQNAMSPPSLGGPVVSGVELDRRNYIHVPAGGWKAALALVGVLVCAGLVYWAKQSGGLRVTGSLVEGNARQQTKDRAAVQVETEYRETLRTLTFLFKAKSGGVKIYKTADRFVGEKCTLSGNIMFEAKSRTKDGFLGGTATALETGRKESNVYVRISDLPGDKLKDAGGNLLDVLPRYDVKGEPGSPSSKRISFNGKGFTVSRDASGHPIATIKPLVKTLG